MVPGVGSGEHTRAIDQYLGRRPRLIILGHEWVGQVNRMMRQFMARFGFDDDVNQGTISLGWIYAHLLMLSRRFSEVHLRMAPMATNRSGDDIIEDEILAINALSPDIILIHLGGNELIDRYYNPVDAATDVYNLGRRLLSSCSSLHIAFIGCVNRLGGPHDFMDRVMAFNYSLNQLAGSSPNMSFHKLRGFQTMPDGSPLPVSRWSINGFTPNPASHFFMKYLHELRLAAFKSLVDIDEFMLSLDQIPDFFDDQNSNRRGPPPPLPPPLAAAAAC